MDSFSNKEMSIEEIKMYLDRITISLNAIRDVIMGSGDNLAEVNKIIKELADQVNRHSLEIDDLR